MFELIHRPAFHIMGKGTANPVGTFWSSVMLLDHLGEAAAAERSKKAIEQVKGGTRASINLILVVRRRRAT